MPHTDKQPQTVYLAKNIQYALNGKQCGYLEQVQNVYIITPEELEAMKAEWQREAAEKGWSACWQRYVRPDAYPYSLNKVDFIDENFPLPQPPKD